jgi:hypothetical protein
MIQLQRRRDGDISFPHPGTLHKERSKRKKNPALLHRGAGS